MRRRTKLNLNPKYVLIILLVICVSFILISFRFGKSLYPVRNAVGSAITSYAKGINIVGTFISDKLDTFRNMKELIQENEN